MNKMFFVLLVLLIHSGGLKARTLELQKNARSIFVEVKPNWTLGKDLFGMPFVLFSPRAHGQRSNISFTDTGANLEIEVNALKNNQKNFRQSKEKWAKSVGARPIEFSPYSLLTSKLGHKIHRIGFSYQHEDKIYVEASHLIECRGKLLHSKSLRLKENLNHEKDFQDLIQSIDCSGV